MTTQEQDTSLAQEDAGRVSWIGRKASYHNLTET